jgi:integrase
MTDIAVSRLKSPGTYHDTITKAFGLRVGKFRKTWFVIRGKQRLRTTIGRYSEHGMSLADARKEAKRLLAEDPKNTDHIKFGEAYDDYKVEIESKKPRTQADYKRFLEKFLVDLKNKKLLDLGYDDVKAVADKLGESEAIHALAVARTFFRWCVRPPRRYIPHSPLEGVTLKLANKRKRVLEPDELAKVWYAAQEQGYPHGTVVQLLILNGQRRGEIANLRWPWINTRERTIKLPDWICKNKKEHIFPYGQMTADILEAVPRLNSTDLLFPSRISDERPISGWSKFKHELDDLIEDELDRFTLHDLRRTYRTLHASIGTLPYIGERLINHVAAVTTEVEQIYDLYKYLPEMRQAVTNLEAHLNALFDPRPEPIPLSPADAHQLQPV